MAKALPQARGDAIAKKPSGAFSPTRSSQFFSRHHIFREPFLPLVALTDRSQTPAIAQSHRELFMTALSLTAELATPHRDVVDNDASLVEREF
jgi:hypothetical protein